jgi:hypothetical protein
MHQGDFPHGASMTPDGKSIFPKTQRIRPHRSVSDGNLSIADSPMPSILRTDRTSFAESLIVHDLWGRKNTYNELF